MRDWLGRISRLATLGRLKVWREREEIRRAAITFAAGLVVLVLMQNPSIERSFLGDLDREMLDTAFKLRTDVISGRADPVLFLDIDDVTLTGEPNEANVNAPTPSATTPRGLLADLLNYIQTAPPREAAQVVIVDVDIGTPTPGDEAGMAKLEAALRTWSANAQAPPLIIAREAFQPQAMGVPGEVKVLPVTPYDPLVQAAPNIFWASVKMLADKEGIVREFLPFECVRTRKGIEPLFSSVLLAYGFLQAGELPPDSNARAWIERASRQCAEAPGAPVTHGERINYHLSFEMEFEDRVWPDLHRDWKGFQACGGGDTAVFRRVSAINIAESWQEASRSILCQRIVIIGGTNTPAADFRQTPMDEMAGPAIIANSVRGLQMSGGGLKQIAFPLQILVLLAVSLGISAAFALSRRARARFSRVRAKGRGLDPSEGLQLIALNPVVLNWTLAIVAHFLGVGLLLLSLDLSFWGYLSAPAVGAAVMETIQEFADD
jgi:CHASE2 domain-containing sensor protein